MNTALKTLAIAGLMGTMSAPAFAAAHMSSSMTCAEWGELSPEDQMTVASMAIAEVEGGADGGSLEEGAKADEPVSEEADTTEAEADTGTTGSLEGSAESDEPASEPMNSAAVSDEAMQQFVAMCEQNMDAMVSEAAIGMSGSN